MEKILAQLITPGSIDYEEVEIDLEELQLGTLELDRKLTSNIREKAAVLLRIIDGDSIITYEDAPRTKHEINGAYKIALRRGATINETKVYNMFFKFKSYDGMLDGTGIALMWRPPETNEEWIMLLPDDTRERIFKEKRLYLSEARELVFTMLMNPDDQSLLLENLNMLNIHERCAQSLMHEYGHVLHWREFDLLGITAYHLIEQYEWFLGFGYLHNVSARFPEFDKKSASDKIVLLKESLVEDYRISLNTAATRGKFILPNKVCFSGDFQNPELLEGGIEIMKRMLRTEKGIARRNPSSSPDLDSIQLIKAVRSSRRKSGWVAGKVTVTDNVIARDLEELRNLTVTYNQVAATTSL